VSVASRIHAGVLLLLAGCATGGSDAYFRSTRSAANVYVAPVATSIEKVAIMPFKAPTELIGASVSDMFVTELLRAGRYTLVERSQMANVLSESELALAGLSEKKAVEVGNMLGADAVIIGTVDEYGTVAKGGRTIPVVGIALRMIDCQSGKVMWSADLARRAESGDVTLPEQARKVVHEITAGLYQGWDVQRKAPRASAAADAPASRARAPDPAVAAPSLRAAPPAPPEGLSVSDMELRQATLSWEAPAAADGDYRIERSDSPKGPFKALGRAAPKRGAYLDKADLKDGATYYYRLIPVSAAGAEGPPSRVLESMTAPPPEPPRNLAATSPSSRAVSLSWQPPGSEGVVKYRVERAEASAPDAFAERGVVEKCAFAEGGKPGTDLRDSARYLYRVTAVNRVGAVGTPSAPVEVVTLPPPAPIEGLQARSGEVRCVPLSWRASPEGDVTHYEVHRTDSAGGAPARIAKLVGRDKTAWLDGGADPGSLPDDATFRYTVRAFNAVGGSSELCAPAEATTRAVPPAVEDVSARSGEPRAATVTWAVSPDEKVLGYAVSRAEGDDGDFEDVMDLKGRTTTSWTDRGGARRPDGPGALKDGTAYRYRVLAYNTARARSPWSAVASARTKPAPVSPAGLGASTNRPGSVVLWWKANPESDIVAYVVESRDAKSGRWRELARVPPVADTVPASETRLGDGERRVYRVKAVDADTLESAWSDEAPGASKPLPDAPTGVRAEWAEGSAVVTWQPPPQPDIAGYRVWKKGMMSATQIATSTACRAVLGPSDISAKAGIQVSAVDADGLESARTLPVEVRAPAGAKP
jgi:hypothetical protein